MLFLAIWNEDNIVGIGIMMKNPIQKSGIDNQQDF